MFTRNLGTDSMGQLKKEKLFNNQLLPDIERGSVFAAIRNDRVDFYFKGGKLFSYNKKEGFSSHIKYATTPEDDVKNYITEKEFPKTCGRFIKDFEKDYNKIKNNCELYSKGSEAACVAHLYNKYSFINSAINTVVLDIEISLESREGKNQDRIDILLYSKRNKLLQFVEAKLYTNKEIRSKNRPEVIGQIERYNTQIKNRENEILVAYRRYVEIINELFSLELEKPTGILQGVGLYIFGFDDDQKKGNLLRQIIPNLEKDRIRYYSLGNSASINIQTLWDAATKL